MNKSRVIPNGRLKSKVSSEADGGHLVSSRASAKKTVLFAHKHFLLVKQMDFLCLNVQ